MRLSRTAIFNLLMIAAVLTAILPTRWTAWSGRILQPMAWAQSVSRLVTRHAVEQVEGAAAEGRSVPLSDYLTLEERVADLERHLLHKDLSMQALTDRIEQLSGLRDQLRDSNARIVVARITGGDASPDREMLRISAGVLRGLEVGDWVVTSGKVTEGEEITNRERVWRQWLIGRVSEVQPHTSWVQLATDRNFGPIQISIAGTDGDDQASLAAGSCILQGLGGGRMVIRQATEDYLEKGYSRAMVRLPAAIPLVLTIGELRETSRRTDSPLHFDIEVRPPASLARNDAVWVLKFD